MKQRTTLLAGNWKMNKTAAEAVAWLEAFQEGPALQAVAGGQVEAAVCAPFTALYALDQAKQRLQSPVGLGAQDLHWEAKGAYTGEISPQMLQEFGVRYVICGHSERRSMQQESSMQVSKKCGAAVAAGLTPILCVGESLNVREGGLVLEWLEAQLFESLNFWDNQQEIVVAYEPIWAIGTTKAATAADAEEACAYIRQVLRQRAGERADQLRVLYGGGVNPENIGELLACPNIDGALVGGASLDPAIFAQLVLAGQD